MHDHICTVTYVPLADRRLHPQPWHRNAPLPLPPPPDSKLRRALAGFLARARLCKAGGNTGDGGGGGAAAAGSGEGSAKKPERVRSEAEIFDSHMDFKVSERLLRQTLIRYFEC